MNLLPSFCCLNARQIICCVHFVSTMETTFPSSLVQCCPDLTLFPASSLVQLQPNILALLPAPLGHGERVWNEQKQRKGQSGKSWIKLQFLRIRRVRRVLVPCTAPCASRAVASDGGRLHSLAGCPGPTSPALLAPIWCIYLEYLSQTELAQVKCFAGIQVRGSFPVGILQSTS